eukprot:TRINITY_DN15241_c0_g1_i1.p1 TRINITY_DN15241_c0_g1~~TRINITY_DN15241_c0_g1_i1.p1  ORF type:complete len:341 (+),score=78.76 TRINITY_DN15241_c0_g1_i1:51-1025(+)
MTGKESLTWNEESASELGVNYDPSEYWVERASTVRKQVKDRRKTLQSYKQLRGTLDEMLEQTKHKAIIPCGEMAILEGTISSTNEILAFLGAGWFANRSVPQCRRMISSRESIIQDDLDSLIEEEKNCNKRVQMLLKFEGLIDDLPSEQPKKKVVPHKDIEAAQTLKEKLQIIEDMEAKGQQTEFEVDEECEEPPQTALPILTDEDIANRLRSAGVVDTPSSGIMAKLDEIFTPDAEEPKFADPSQIFSAYSGNDDVPEEVVPKPLKKRVSFSEDKDIKLHPDDEKNAKAESTSSAKPTVVGETIVVRSSSCVPPPPPPMRVKK